MKCMKCMNQVLSTTRLLFDLKHHFLYLLFISTSPFSSYKFILHFYYHSSTLFGTHLLAPSIMQNFRIFFFGGGGGKSRVMTASHFWTQNVPIALENYVRKIVNVILMYLLASLILQNLKKNPWCRSRVMTINNVWALDGPFPPFFSMKKLLIYFPRISWPLSLYKLIKNLLQWIDNYDNAWF